MSPDPAGDIIKKLERIKASMDTDEQHEATLRAQGILPAKRNLTIIWEEEKLMLIQRIEALEAQILQPALPPPVSALEYKVEALELDVKDLQSKLQSLLEAFRTKPQPSPGAGIGQAIPKAVR